MNCVSIIGHIGQDIEIRYTNSGTAIANFSIAVNKTIGGEKQTSWFKIKAFKKQAETIYQYFKKGDQIGIVGELKQEKWISQNGEKREQVVIILNSFTFINSTTEETDKSKKIIEKEIEKPMQDEIQIENKKVEYTNEEIPF